MIQEIIQNINEISGSNQFLGGAIAAWLLGVMTYLCRSIPNSAYQYGKKQLTTTLTITSYHEVFHDTMRWLGEKGYAKKFRRVKLSNGQYGNDEMYKSLGYGRHFFWYRCRLMTVELNRETTDRNEDKELITFVKFGRSHKLLDKLVSEIKASKKKDDAILNVRTWYIDYWKSSSSQPIRPEASIYLAEGVKEKLWEALDTFMSQEEFYSTHGIPYHFGILLHGPPGTGKTSVVKALASYLKQDLNILQSSELGSLGKAAAELDPKQIMLVEDFDSYCPATAADSDKKATASPLLKIMDDAGLSALLNNLDGVASTHGRIVVFTTNHLDKIDSAVLRPGRIDLKIEVGYVDNHSMDKFLTAFFGRGLEGRTVQIPDLTIAALQGEVLAGKDYDYFAKTYC